METYIIKGAKPIIAANSWVDISSLSKDITIANEQKTKDKPLIGYFPLWPLLIRKTEETLLRKKG
jgi:hypothetical protein